MALKSSYISILKTIKEAPHAVPFEAMNGLIADDLSCVVGNLVGAGYIKPSADGSGYFTRTPKRDAIMDFLTGRTETLEGITFDSDSAIPESDYRQILSDIINAPEALCVAKIHPSMDDGLFDTAIQNLKSAKLIKEHAHKGDFYFTRKPMRRAIELFLEDEIGIEELFERAAQRAAEAATSETPQAVVPQAPEPDTTPLCEMDEAFEAYLFESMDANLLTLRAAIDAAQRAYDALAAYRGR